MLAQPGSSLSQFVDSYHLWDAVLLFAVLGIYDFLTIVIRHGGRFLEEVDDVVYHYKTHRVENRRRYQQIAAKQESAIAHGAGRTDLFA